jgi:hypothetical protein
MFGPLNSLDQMVRPSYWAEREVPAGDIKTVFVEDIPIPEPVDPTEAVGLMVSAEAPKKEAVGREAAARDATVLETVLLDLLTCPDSPWESRRGKKKQVFFSTEALTRGIDAEDVLRTNDDKALDKLSKEQLAAAKEAAADLSRRTKKKDVFKAFVPKDKRVAMFTKEQDQKAEKEQEKSFHLIGPQVFRAYAPGYSRDGKVAVVWLWFPWSIHSGDGLYLLAKSKDKWTVLVRDFRIYP